MSSRSPSCSENLEVAFLHLFLGIFSASGEMLPSSLRTNPKSHVISKSAAHLMQEISTRQVCRLHEDGTKHGIKLSSNVDIIASSVFLV
jgi:hypothetical protein